MWRKGGDKIIEKEIGETTRIKKKRIFHPFIDEIMSEKNLDLIWAVREKAESWDLQK